MSSSRDDRPRPGIEATLLAVLVLVNGYLVAYSLVVAVGAAAVAAAAWVLLYPVENRPWRTPPEAGRPGHDPVWAASLLAPIAFGACYLAGAPLAAALVIAVVLWPLIVLIEHRRTPRGAGR